MSALQTQPVTPTTAEVGLRLPRTLSDIYRMVEEEYSFAALDENLWAFRGFFDMAGDTHCQARQWEKVRPAGISAGDVTGFLSRTTP